MHIRKATRILIFMIYTLQLLLIGCTNSNNLESKKVNPEERNPCLFALSEAENMFLYAYVIESSKNKEISKNKSQVMLKQVFTMKMHHKLKKALSYNTSGELSLDEETLKEIIHHILNQNDKFIPATTCTKSIETENYFETHSIASLSIEEVLNQLENLKAIQSTNPEVPIDTLIISNLAN